MCQHPVRIGKATDSSGAGSGQPRSCRRPASRSPPGLDLVTAAAVRLAGTVATATVLSLDQATDGLRTIATGMPRQDPGQRGRVTVVRHTVPVAYDEELAERVRVVVAAEPGLTEKRMFGGLAFLVHGHMAVAASSQGRLLLRVDPAEADSLLGPSVTRTVMRGRELTGWLDVGPAAITTDDALCGWVAHGLAYARALPPK